MYRTGVSRFHVEHGPRVPQLVLPSCASKERLKRLPEKGSAVVSTAESI